MVVGEENILSFWDAMELHEPLLCTHATLETPFRTAAEQIDRIQALAEYPFPLAAIAHEEGLRIAGSVLAEMPRCFDTMFSFSPWFKPFPAAQWYKTYPDTIWEGIPYANRNWDICYVGRGGSRKRPNLIAAALEEYPNSIVVLSMRGISGKKIYQVCKEWIIDTMVDPPRDTINKVFNESRFLIYPSDFGPVKYRTLENSVLEALTCMCAPILNSVWCMGRFKDYPAQVSTVQDCADLVLNEDLWSRCLQFMENLDAINHDCRTGKELFDILNAREYAVDPERGRRCQRVAEFFSAGQHLLSLRARFNRGPFYRYDLPKTMDFKETFYV